MGMNTDEIVPVVIETATEKVTITGSCNMCGKCCRPPAFSHPDFLINYTAPKPGYRIEDGYCKYLTDVQPDGRQLCNLFIAEEENRLDEYPEEDVEYWKRCCKSWPTYDGEVTVEWVKARIEEGCFDECSFVPTLELKSQE